MYTFETTTTPGMEGEEQQQTQPPRRRRNRRRSLILSATALLLVSVFTALYIGFNYYGERLLRKYLQDKILLASNGVYRADFRQLHVNILTGKLVLDSFELIPDTARYRTLKEQGKMARSLYRLSFESLLIDRVHFRQVFAGRRINFRQLIIERPKLTIAGFPDTLTARRSRWRVIYEDLYPAVAHFFNDFHIDSVKVNHGHLLTSFSLKTGRKSTGEYEFSSTLKDVSVNPFSYYNRQRVFYSRDVDLVIHNFESALADSLYLLRAEEIGFSLTRSVLYGKKASLSPDFRTSGIRHVQGGDLFRIDLPAFSISGVDLYRAMTSREVEISKVSLDDVFVQVLRNKPDAGASSPVRSRKKITLAGLYTVVAKELRYIAIDTLALRNGSFEYYGTLNGRTPELRVGTVNLRLDHFRLDSLTGKDPGRIFYARAIELGIERISLNLGDGIHHLTASSVDFSTLASRIDVRDASVFPDRKKNNLSEKPRNLMFVNMPRLAFSGIDLKKVFNRRILDFRKLDILEPEAWYTRYRQPKQTDPRFKTPEDFFEEENNEVVYDLLKKYLWAIRGEEIAIGHGLVKYSIGRTGGEVPVATSSFDLAMREFLIDSVHRMNDQGYFYSRDFDLDLRSLSIVSVDSLKLLKADRVHIATADSLIEAAAITLVRSADPFRRNSITRGHTSLTLDFRLDRLQLNGLNHKKLFLDNVLRANQILFDNPSLFLKTSAGVSLAGPPEESSLLNTEKLIKTFEIGRFIVRKGTFSYDGGEDRRAAFFSLKDIDFAVVNATVHIPGKGMHDGVIRFDSLQLKVLPLRAVIADSAYLVEAGSLEVHSYPADIILKSISVKPLRGKTGDPAEKIIASINIPEIRLDGFWFDKAVFDNRWEVERITVERPVVSLSVPPGKRTAPAAGVRDPNTLVALPAFMTYVDVGKLSVTEAEIALKATVNGTVNNFVLRNFMLDVNRFSVDPATRASPASAPLFNARDIRVSSRGVSRQSADGMYTVSLGRFGFSTADGTAFFDSVVVSPNYSRKEFPEKLGHQADRVNIILPGVRVSGIDFRRLAGERILHAGRVHIDRFTFEDYLDKRPPPGPLRRQPMPGRLPGSLPFAASVDSVTFSNGMATYEEQTGAEPGRVFLTGMAGTLTGFSTQTPAVKNLSLQSTFLLMGSSPVSVDVEFLRNHPRDSFSLRATIGELDLRTINPMLSKLVPVSITQGTATGTEILSLIGNDSIAGGIMNLRFNNLAIKLNPTQPGTWNRIENSLLTEAVNLFLQNSNPGDDGKMKQGIIYYERDPSRGYINFVWKSVLSGIKSSAGLNSKKQKQTRKLAK